MAIENKERTARSVPRTDTQPSQNSYAPGQRSTRQPISVEMVDVGRKPTVPASQRVVANEPASWQPSSEESSVRINVRPDSAAPSTQRSSTPSTQLTQTPASKVLSSFRRDWNGLKTSTDREPEFGQLRRYVSDVVSTIGMDANNVYVLQMKQFKDLYRNMPLSMREAAKSGFTSGLDTGLIMPVTERLAELTRRPADASLLDGMPERHEFQRVIDLIDDTAGGLLPQRILQVARDLLLMAISARAFDNLPVQRLLRPFTSLLEDGRLTVGLTKERRFLVVTL